MKEETILFECACSSREHPFVVSVDEDIIYGTIHLTHFCFWERLWVALKYIFGYHCRYGHFEEIIFRNEDAVKLEKVVDRMRKG